MFALLLDELYDIMDKLSYIKWELANRRNPTVNDNLVFDPFRTIERFWNLLSTYCFSFYFILMSLQLSPLELTRLVIMPGVTDEMAQIFQYQPIFILGLQYFTYTSQHIDRLEREIEQAWQKQVFLFDRIVEDGFEQKIRPLIIRNCQHLICCRNWLYATALSSHSDESEEPPSTPSSQAIDEIVRQTIPLRRQQPTRIPILSTSLRRHAVTTSTDSSCFGCIMGTRTSIFRWRWHTCLPSRNNNAK